jgi:hypothetical protein
MGNSFHSVIFRTAPCQLDAEKPRPVAFFGQDARVPSPQFRRDGGFFGLVLRFVDKALFKEVFEFCGLFLSFVLPPLAIPSCGIANRIVLYKKRQYVKSQSTTGRAAGY